jgi:hypothetical protein
MLYKLQHNRIKHSFSKHSLNSKFRVFATEAFRSEKSNETSDTEVLGEINETFEPIYISSKFRIW